MGKGGLLMVKLKQSRRRITVGINLRRLIKQDRRFGTIVAFANAHGSDLRTVKRWLKDGVDSLSTIEEIANTLGVSDLELLLSNK